MKTIFFLLLAIPCLSQDRFLKESDIENAHIKKGIVLYDTLEKGQGGAFRFILTDFGTVDTTKMIIVKYEAFQIDGTVVPIKETIIDGVTTNPANQYSGAWVHSTASWTSVFGGTASYSATPGAILTITFTGNRIQWFSEKSNNKGTAAVSIDGGPEVTVNLFATNATPPNVKSMVFESPELPQGPHTFKIRVVTASVLHDEVKVFSR